MKKCKKCGAPLEGFLYNTIGKLMGVKPSEDNPEICNKCAEEQGKEPAGEEAAAPEVEETSVAPEVEAAPAAPESEETPAAPEVEAAPAAPESEEEPKEEPTV